MLKNTATRLGFGFAVLVIFLAITLAGNSGTLTASTRQAAQETAASQMPAGYLAKLGESISAEFGQATP